MSSSLGCANLSLPGPSNLMTPERWRQVEELYHAVQEDRAALEKADPELRREVESLLAQPRGDAPLDRPVVDLPDDATVTQMAVDSTLGPYRIEGLLGAGGMGEVYRAVDTRLGRKVAIKMAGKQFTQRFEREARTIAALNHPNICTLYDIGPHYLVMELLEGETLRGRLKRSPPDWRGAAEIAAAVAEGLAAAHFRRIVHHDLKPENIFLTQPADGTAGRTVILDFGLARWTASDVRAGETASVITQAGMIMGTVGYMSPEQVRGDATGPASDLFSLGCVLYEMLAGRPPFKRFTATETLLAILRDAFEPLPSALPVDLIHQVARCLEKTPELRCRSAGELASSLRSILSGQSPSGATVTQGQESLIDSLAIVPFKNTSGNADTDFLSDGITESLINSFSRLPGLRVVARSRVFRYKGKDFEAAALGRELGVRALLTGRVLQRGETLRVQAELVEAASETQIWGERFQGNLADILTFEEQIALQIAAKLRPRMGVGEKASRPTGDPHAYRLYLQGLHAWHQRTGASLAKALGYFERAIQADPQYALPYHGLAEALIVLTFFNAGAPKQLLERALVAGSRAVAIDPGFGPAHAALAHAHGWLNHNWTEANAELEKAVEADPNNALVYDRRALVRLAQGRPEEAIAAQLRSLEIEPLSLSLQHHLAWCFLLARQYERATEQARQVLELDRRYPFACLWLAIAMERLGRYEAAEAAFAQMGPGFGGNPAFGAFTGHLLAVTGRVENALAILAEGERLWERGYFEPFALALICVALGRTEAALDWLERAEQVRSSWLTVHAALDSRLDPLRSHPRFQGLMIRMDLPYTSG